MRELSAATHVVQGHAHLSTTTGNVIPNTTTINSLIAITTAAVSPPPPPSPPAVWARPCKHPQAAVGSHVQAPTSALSPEMDWRVRAICPVLSARVLDFRKSAEACGSPCHSPCPAFPSVPMETLTVGTRFLRPAEQVPLGTADVGRGKQKKARVEN